MQLGDAIEWCRSTPSLLPEEHACVSIDTCDRANVYSQFHGSLSSTLSLANIHKVSGPSRIPTPAFRAA